MQGKTRNEQCRNECVFCDEQDKQRKITNEQCRNESDFCDEQDKQRKITDEQCRNESDYCDEQDMQTKNANEQSRNESDYCDEQDKQRKITNGQCRNESDYCDEQDMQTKNANEQCRNESDYCDEQDKQRKITNGQCRNESDYCYEQDMQRKNANDTRYEQSSGNSTFVQKGFREYLDYTLLKRPLFLCFGISVMLATCGHSPATVMLPPLAIEHHVTPQRAAFLLSVTGIADIVGRLAFGFLCDIDILRNNRHMASIFINGIANLTCGFSTQCWQFVTYSVIIGLFAGFFNALTPVILVDLLESGKLTSSFGLALHFQGTARIANGRLPRKMPESHAKTTLAMIQERRKIKDTVILNGRQLSIPEVLALSAGLRSFWPRTL
ncbi:LOW QUALITY PROTEIN: MOT12-like protein [Mya arenaria]|uniref:MOT12-like protein n=1 Tax=Mya arenaria TaxID=6604 RepID=A0ABY7EFP8_MYAAR|nr:LOW QUALITY PROTEIN: MOT12-like protein [Mya arenaria]